MKIYKQINNSNEKKIPKKVSKQDPKEVSKQVPKAETEDSKELSELRDENKRLQKIVDKNRKELKNIIDKALEYKVKDKTSVLQTLELFRFNAYLISCLPDSERVLENYLSTKNEIPRHSSGHSVASGSGLSNGSNYKKNVRKSPQKPMNQISNYFKSVAKSEQNGKSFNTESDTEDNASPVRRVSPRKRSNVPETPERYPQRKRKQSNLSENTAEETDDNSKRTKDLNTGSGRTGRGRKSQTQRESEAEHSNAKPNESISSTTSLSPNKSRTETSKAGTEEKKKVVRKRRTRVQEYKGYFPCVFDPKQCNEIMDTKEHLDFHMSGHYDAQYTCPFCAYTGPTIQIIKRHINNERENVDKLVANGKPLNKDQKDHKGVKIYRCFGCKVCNKIHDKLEKRCNHITEDSDNECEFSHDIEYEFKDHLKRHFGETFNKIKDKDLKREKIKAIVNKFVDEHYFENNAKKSLLVDRYNQNERQQKSDEKPTEVSSDSEWD